MASSNRRDVRASLFGCFLVSCGFLTAYLFFPSRDVYVYLTGAVTVVGLFAWLWSKRFPARALQTYWWTVLVVVACMSAMDARVYADEGLPTLVWVPPFGAYILRKLLAGLRPSLAYGIGVLALLFPAGLVYDEWGNSLVLIGVVVAIVMTGARRTELRKATQLLEADNKRRASGLQKRRK